nr:hypothetical protein [uncultured Pseudomonas sp.]
MNMREIEAQAKALAPVFGRVLEQAKAALRDEFKGQIEARDLRIAELEKSLAAQVPPTAEEVAALVDVAALAKSAAELVPVPENGKDADMEVLKSHLSELVAALPTPKDGRSVTVDDVRPMIEEAVENLRKDAGKIFDEQRAKSEEASESVRQALAELKQPEDGISVTAEDVAPMIRDEVAKAIAEIPAAKDGQSITAEDVRPMLTELVGDAVKALPAPENGKDADMEALRNHVGDLVKSIQLPAGPSVDEVAAGFERRFSDLTLSWERQARDTFEKAADRLPKPKDGRDALPLESFDLLLGEDGRTVTVKLQAGETTIEKSVKIPAIIDRDTFKHDATYEKGDGVSYGGSFWIAKCDNPQGVPGSGETDWRCAVKKGRDGKDLRDNASRHDPAKGVSIK